MIIFLVILALGFVALAIVCTLDFEKIRKVKADNSRLIALYEPMRQKAAGVAAPQIQDISADGKALLETIVELLKEQGATLDLVHGFIKSAGPAPAETPAPAPAETPAPAPAKVARTRRVKKEKKTAQASNKGDKSK